MLGRARKGGEVGLNGEFYKGGQFMPSSSRTEKGAYKPDKLYREKSKSLIGRKREIAPYKWVPITQELWDIFASQLRENEFIIAIESTYMDTYNGRFETEVSLAIDKKYTWAVFFGNIGSDRACRALYMGFEDGRPIFSEEARIRKHASQKAAFLEYRARRGGYY